MDQYRRCTGWEEEEEEEQKSSITFLSCLDLMASTAPRQIYLNPTTFQDISFPAQSLFSLQKKNFSDFFLQIMMVRAQKIRREREREIGGYLW